MIGNLHEIILNPLTKSDLIPHLKTTRKQKSRATTFELSHKREQFDFNAFKIQNNQMTM